MITNRQLFVLSLLCVFLSISLHVRISKSGVSKLHRLCHSDVNTLCQDVVGHAQVVKPPPSTTLFENLNRLSQHDGQEEEHYDYWGPKDICMWQAFLNNEIKSEECSAAMENVQKQQLPFFYCSNLTMMLVHVLALFLTWSYYCYAIASVMLCLSPPFKDAVTFGPLFVSVLYTRVAPYPVFST